MSHYLDLLGRVLTNSIYQDRDVRNDQPYSAHLRRWGLDWPAQAHTMIGAERLRHLRWCCEEILERGVPGDFIECGVWRGGAAIMMAATLREWGDVGRTLWLADSFRGLPPPKLEQDAGDAHHTQPFLAVPQAEVEENFRRYGLLSDRVRFLPGWFSETLPAAPIDGLAVLRLDGDMYESTMVALESLYPKLSPGGFCIVDDYGCLESCRQAVSDYRARAGVAAPIENIDGTGVFWRAG